MMWSSNLWVAGFELELIVIAAVLACGSCAYLVGAWITKKR